MSPRLAILGILLALGTSVGIGSRSTSQTLETGAKVPLALPGAVPFTAELRQRLADELAKHGSGYEPRTRHLAPDGAPLFSNRLLLESSPYLQQHAHNPVNWYPWGDAAFEAARRLGRPVLVSIGYSTCHWCHVMEEESFDDLATATLLNARFVAIKVDRELRPDVDAIYMTAMHVLDRPGGWPLNVFLTPDGLPFYGGTYFPPGEGSSRGRPGFMRVLRELSARYGAGPDEIAAFSRQLAEAIETALEGEPTSATRIPGPEALDEAKAWYARRFDPIWGGIGSRQKFPASLPVRLLLRHHRRTGDAEALSMASVTLQKMAEGGIHDFVGGGFHRYSVDPQWRVPHFEKMLYDNALLALAYLEGWQVTGREDFAQGVRGILDYVARDMTAPGGGFYSASDADSRSPDGESVEGWFFTWRAEEIRAALPPEQAEAVLAFHAVAGEGPVEGRHVLRAALPAHQAATALGIAVPELRRRLDAAYPRLRTVRERRPPPLRDEKILTAWNGLMISAFARAGFALDEPDWIRRARRAAEFVLGELRREGRLLRVWMDGRADGPAFLEDHAFLVAGLLDLYEADADPRWLREALTIQAALDRDHGDPSGGYFRTAHDHETLLAREKPAVDGAVPSGNSVAALNLLRLNHFTGDPEPLQRASLIFSTFYERLVGEPGSLAELRLALDAHHDTPKEVIVVGSADDGAKLDALLAPLRRAFLPNRILVVVDPAKLDGHVALVPVLRGKVARGGEPTAYVCKNQVCDLPTTDPEVFERQLAKLRRVEAERAGSSP